MARLLDVPREIIDEILSEIESHLDLLSFALCSHACAEIAIPNQIEYRVIRIRAPLPAVWAHLALRSDLTRNIRHIRLCSRDDYTAPDHYPTTLVDAPPPDSNTEGTRIFNICLALSHMQRLSSFVWNYEPDTKAGLMPNHLHEEMILRAVSQAPELRHLMLRGHCAMHVRQGIGIFKVPYPVLSISHLDSLSLCGASWDRSNYPALIGMLKLSPRVRVLQIPVELPGLNQCHFPNLKKLMLPMTSGFANPMAIPIPPPLAQQAQQQQQQQQPALVPASVAAAAAAIAPPMPLNPFHPPNLSEQHHNNIVAFLAAHPTIEELLWFPFTMDLEFPPTPPDDGEADGDGEKGFLPRLRCLESNANFMDALEDACLDSSYSSSTSSSSPTGPGPAPGARRRILLDGVLPFNFYPGASSSRRFVPASPRLAKKSRSTTRPIERLHIHAFPASRIVDSPVLDPAKLKRLFVAQLDEVTDWSKVFKKVDNDEAGKKKQKEKASWGRERGNRGRSGDHDDDDDESEGADVSADERNASSDSADSSNKFNRIRNRTQNQNRNQNRFDEAGRKGGVADGGLFVLRQIATKFKQLEWISLPDVVRMKKRFGGEREVLRIELQTWLTLLPLFPSLHTFRGQGLWSAVDGDKTKMHEVIMELVERCPKLEALDHCEVDVGRRGVRVVRVFREWEGGAGRGGVEGGEGKVKGGKGGERRKLVKAWYEVEKPPPRADVFDRMNAMFD